MQRPTVSWLGCGFNGLNHQRLKRLLPRDHLVLHHRRLRRYLSILKLLRHHLVNWSGGALRAGRRNWMRPRITGQDRRRYLSSGIHLRGFHPRNVRVCNFCLCDLCLRTGRAGGRFVHQLQRTLDPPQQIAPCRELFVAQKSRAPLRKRGPRCTGLRLTPIVRSLQHLKPNRADHFRTHLGTSC